MSKVFNITDRLEDKKRKRDEKNHRQKAESLQRIVQCSSCQLSCAMCSAHLNAPDQVCPPTSCYPDLILCEDCRAEYNDFLRISKGKKDSHIFWHNDEWVSLWSAWLNYRKAIEAFRNSKGFRQLIKDFIKE